MILIILITAALITILLITLLNVGTFPRLQVSTRPINAPLVSILIPARNEARVIGETLRCLLAQDYPHFEILLLDDHSTDGTGMIVRDLADPRLKVIDGAPLPAGWMGKNWACHQLSTHAQGDYWIFTDADVRWEAGALSAVITAAQQHQADLLTVWPTQQTVTWGERLIVPLMALAIIGYLPVIGTHYSPFSIFAAACGQCMVWRRGAYQQIGGHQAVRSTVLEDVTLARLVKAAGLRLWMFDGAGVILCRMYDSWPAVRDGYAKNILAGYGNSIPILLLATVFHWLIFLVPPLWWLFGGGVWAFALTVLGITIRMITAAFTRQRVIDGLAMPISVVLMTVIAFQSIYWQLRYGGPAWKGRIIKQG